MMQSRPGGRAPKLLSAPELWDYALKVLGGRALSSSEVRKKLERKAAEAGDVETTLVRLREYGFINDVAFAENYAAARRDQTLGKMRVLRDLRQRRVSGKVAQEAVDQTFAGVNEDEMVEQFLRRKFRSVKLNEYLQDPKHLASAFRKLRYAGFASTPSIRVLKRYAAQADELETLDEPEGEE